MSRGPVQLTRRLPGDPNLPGLAPLLVPGQFADLARSLLPAGAEILGCRPWYLRYKPATNASVVYQLEIAGQDQPVLVHAKCHTGEDYIQARDKAAAARMLDVKVGLPFAALDDPGILLFNFPNDQGLRGLRFAAHPKRLQRALYAHETGLDDSIWRISDSRMVITPVRFKPEKRAVLRLDTRARHRLDGRKKPVRVYARISTGADAQDRARLMAELHREFAAHPGLAPPRPNVHQAEENTTLVADAGGSLPADGWEAASRAGEVLAAIHASQVTPPDRMGQDDVLQAVADAAGHLQHLAPELGDEARRLADILPDRLAADHGAGGEGFVHGDFHPQQILAAGEQTVVLDFDRSHRGDQAADLGNFMAHLVLDGIRSGQDAALTTAAREQLLRSYRQAGGAAPSARRLSLWTAVGLMLLTPAPFRSLASRWVEQTSALLAACRKELL
jgi:aminoglycoside phosphotransferase (APT) family kinase protein